MVTGRESGRLRDLDVPSIDKELIVMIAKGVGIELCILEANIELEPDLGNDYTGQMGAIYHAYNCSSSLRYLLLNVSYG